MKWLKRMIGLQNITGMQEVINEQKKTNELLEEIIRLKKYSINESAKQIIKRNGIKD